LIIASLLTTTLAFASAGAHRIHPAPDPPHYPDGPSYRQRERYQRAGPHPAGRLPGPNDEIGQLAKHSNSMLSRLEQVESTMLKKAMLPLFIQTGSPKRCGLTVLRMEKKDSPIILKSSLAKARRTYARR